MLQSFFKAMFPTYATEAAPEQLAAAPFGELGGPDGDPYGIFGELFGRYAPQGESDDIMTHFIRSLNQGVPGGS